VRTLFVRVLLFTFLILSSTAVPARADQRGLTGIVVDSIGQPIVRALVSVKSSTGAVLTTTFTDAEGRFRIPADVPDGCIVEASLTGFVAARAQCPGAQSRPPTNEMRLTLTIAPVQEAVVVSATRSEVPAGQLAASVSVFDQETIEQRQTPMVADLIRLSPGVSVVRVGGAGNVTSLFVRGGESNYNKVLLDGIPINEPGGVFNFSNVTSQNLGRVEVVRGAQSALFGSDAMSSVVQMFTRRADRDGTRADGMFETGGYTTVRGSAGVVGKRGAVDYSADAAQFSTDNREPNNEFDNTTLSGTAGIALNPRTALRFVGRAELGDVGAPGATAFGRPDLDATFTRHDGVVGATFTQQTTTTLQQRATYGVSISHQRSFNLIADPPYTPQFAGSSAPFQFSDFPYDSNTELTRHHLSYQADWRLLHGGSSAGTHVVTGAVDWDGERATLRDDLAASVVKASRNNVGYTLQYQALWPRVFVIAGLRVEDNDSFGVDTVPRGSVAWIAHAGNGSMGETKLKASAGLGIKEPTILQSFSPNPGFLGNPDLEPERSRSVEAGIEQRFAHDRAKVEATWFDDRYKNIISTRTLSFSPFRSQYFNIGLTRARGAELSGEIAPLPQVRATAGYTFLASEILESTSPTSAVFRVGQWLFRRPRHSGFAEVTWAKDRLTLDLAALFVGKRVDSDFASLVPPIMFNDSYAQLDLRGSYRLGQYLTIIGAIDNLGDADYMEPLGYPALGRTGRLGLRVGF
jgi:outer membrane cobalamin receptor